MGIKRIKKKGYFVETVGGPTYIRVYYSKKECGDPWTAVIDSKEWNASVNGSCRTCIGMSNNPTHPQGISMFGECVEGRHLGKLINWDDVPENLRNHILARVS